MKPRHAIALAFTFWLLLSPPLHDEDVDLSAPIKHWRPTGHLFDSRDDCQAYKNQLASSSSLITNGGFDSLIRVPLSEKAKSSVQQTITQATCVSSDDTRLNRK